MGFHKVFMGEEVRRGEEGWYENSRALIIWPGIPEGTSGIPEVFVRTRQRPSDTMHVHAYSFLRKVFRDAHFKKNGFTDGLF
jgi:hypothetical protein